MPRPRNLKVAVKNMLYAILSGAKVPTPAEMGALKLSIAYLGVEVKLEESNYGGFFAEGKEPGAGKRKGNGSALADVDELSELADDIDLGDDDTEFDGEGEGAEASHGNH